MKLLLILICIIAVAMTVVFITPANTVYAENSDVVIDLDSNSKFDSFSEEFAYTSGNSLYVAYDNTILSYPNAFTGVCKDIEMSFDSILMLYAIGTETHLAYFNYSSTGITKLDISGFDLNEASIDVNDPPISIIGIYSDGTKYYLQNKDYIKSFDYFTIENDELKVIVDNTALDTASFKNLPNKFLGISGYFATISDFAINNGFLYALINNSLHITSVTNNLSNLSSYKVGSLPSTFTTIDFVGNKLYANSTDGNVYYIHSEQNGTYTNNIAVESPNVNGKISSISIMGDADYAMILGNEKIIKYSINEDYTLSYSNTFDNQAYVHPSSFPITKVAQMSTTANVYSSPKNLQIKTTLSVDDYILVLCEKNDDNGKFFYIVTSNNQAGYIRNLDDVDEFGYISANTNVTELKIGLYAQGLHATTKIYAYPFESATVIKTVDRYEQLVVVDNVAENDDVQVWNYYKVSYVQGDNIVTGYVKVNDVSPYTSLKAPAILKSVKITTNSIGDVVKLYSLPSQSSTMVTELTDGATLELAEEFDKSSTWTKVVYNNEYAYVLTAEIQQEGLTTLQITLIVISCLVVVTTLIMVFFIYRRHKFGY